MLKVWNTRAEIGIGNTIEYGVKAYQVKTAILKCTKVRIKGFNFNSSQKKMLEWPTSMWRNKTNLNMKWTKIQDQNTTYVV